VVLGYPVRRQRRPVRESRGPLSRPREWARKRTSSVESMPILTTTMTKHLLFATLALVTIGILGGCDNVGNAPAGASIQEIQASFNAKPLEERAKEIEQMSIPEGVKQQTIKAPATPSGSGSATAPFSTSH
jgi:hypothetical protein